MKIIVSKKKLALGVFTIISIVLIALCTQLYMSGTDYRINQIDKEHKKIGWRLLKDNLYQNNDGELAIKTHRVIADPEIYADRYISYFAMYDEDEGNILLKNVIDIDSFHQLSQSFYRDDNNLYQHYSMSDGGMFYIFQIEDDIDNFIILNEFYAKDSNRIYHHRGSVDTSIFDYDTFRTCANCYSFTKDKNGYYIFEHKIDIDEMINNPDTSSKDIANLKKLKSL